MMCMSVVFVLSSWVDVVNRGSDETMRLDEVVDKGSKPGTGTRSRGLLGES